MPKCYFTGVEISLDQSYVLDLREAQRRVLEVRSQLVALERLLEQVGGFQTRQLGHSKREVRERVLVCPAVATGFNEGIGTGLFIGFGTYRLKRRAAEVARLKRHPAYGNAVRAAQDETTLSILEFGNEILRAVRRDAELSGEARTAITYGAAAALHGKDLVAAVNELRARAAAGTLAEVGIPKRVIDEVRALLSDSDA